VQDRAPALSKLNLNAEVGTGNSLPLLVPTNKPAELRLGSIPGTDTNGASIVQLETSPRLQAVAGIASAVNDL
jgi:hypothetical protein